MAKLTLIRSEPVMISVPLDLAVLCENCQTISNSRGDRCGVCGSQAILSLKPILDPEPQPPGPVRTIRAKQPLLFTVVALSA